MERAALSISNNIAEGFERGTRDELLSFLYIARGSTGERRSMTHLSRQAESDGQRREAFLRQLQRVAKGELAPETDEDPAPEPS
jgi:four helix bundle protein